MPHVGRGYLIGSKVMEHQFSSNVMQVFLVKFVSGIRRYKTQLSSDVMQVFLVKFGSGIRRYKTQRRRWCKLIIIVHILVYIPF